ncbi:MAG: hypothetical protein ABW208_21035 [Pyrinomonadaceae bacterium]
MKLPKLGRLGAGLAACLLAFAAGVTCFVIWQYGRTPHVPESAAHTPAAPAPQPTVESQPAVDESAVRRPRGPITRIDFRNFTYPSPSAGKRVTVRDGELEYPTHPGCGQSFRVQRVDYVDFDGDGEDEALVRFIDHQACGSSWASVNHFVYTMRKGRPRLLWSFASGSEAYGGEKDFRVEGAELILELYGTWRDDGHDIVLEKEKGLPYTCDRCTNHYSVYRVAWDGGKFRRKSLEVVNCPGGCQVN